MEEKWIAWNPATIPEGQYELIRLEQSWDGVKLTFDDEKYRVVVTYHDNLLSFRSCDEGDRWRTVAEVLSRNDGKFFKNKLLFKVENSNYKKWFQSESYDKWDESEYEHHAFVTVNDIIDVLAFSEPVVKVEKI